MKDFKTRITFGSDGGITVEGDMNTGLLTFCLKQGLAGEASFLKIIEGGPGASKGAGEAFDLAGAKRRARENLSPAERAFLDESAAEAAIGGESVHFEPGRRVEPTAEFVPDAPKALLGVGFNDNHLIHNYISEYRDEPDMPFSVLAMRVRDLYEKRFSHFDQALITDSAHTHLMAAIHQVSSETPIGRGDSDVYSADLAGDQPMTGTEAGREQNDTDQLKPPVLTFTFDQLRANDIVTPAMIPMGVFDYQGLEQGRIYRVSNRLAHSGSLKGRGILVLEKVNEQLADTGPAFSFNVGRDLHFYRLGNLGDALDAATAPV